MPDLRFPVAVLAALVAIAGPARAADEANDVPALDITVEARLATDYMDSGLTNSDHHPSAGTTVTVNYGVAYAIFDGATIDYGSRRPKAETYFTLGATPVFGDLAVDVNLERQVLVDDPSQDRWKPYVTATWTASEVLSASLGAGYFAYDDPDAADYAEFYAAATYTFAAGPSLTGEVYWEPNADGGGNDYYGVYGTLELPVIEALTFTGEVGVEAYEDRATPTYLWWEAALTYRVNDAVGVTVGYQGNDLSGADCPAQAYTDCDGVVFARVSLTTALSDWTADTE